MQSIDFKSKGQKIVNQARKMRGYLEKKSNNFFVGYQKRFFLIIEDNLVYFVDQTLDTPKGYIQIRKIQNIKAIGNSEFSFKYHERLYYLKSNDTLQRNEWIKSIDLINQYLLYQKPQKITQEIPSKWKKSQKQKKLKNFASLQIQNKKYRSVNYQEIQKYNRSIFKTLSLNKIFQQYDHQKIKNRILVKKFKEGYYFIFSCRSFNKEYEDDIILSREQYILPYDFNILYSFKNQDLQAKKCFQTSKINIIEVIDNKYLKINDLLLTYEDSIDQFITDLKATRQIGKQYHNQLKIPVRKNIEKIIQIDSQKIHPIQKLTKLKFKFLDQFQKFVQKQDKNCQSCKQCQLCNICQICKLKQIYQICQSCNKYELNTGCKKCRQCKICRQNKTYVKNHNELMSALLNDIKNTINAFRIKTQAKKYLQVIKVYTEFTHTRIYKIIKIFWDKNYEILDSSQILTISAWIYQYNQIIKDYIKDIRMFNGIKILNRIFIKRAIQEVQQFIKVKITEEQVFQLSVVNTTKLPLQFCLFIQKKIKAIICSSNIKQPRKVVQEFVNCSYNILYDNIIQRISIEKKLSILIGLCNDVWMYRKQIEYISEIQFTDLYKINKKMHDEILKKIINVIQEQFSFSNNNIFQLNLLSYFKFCYQRLKVTELHSISLKQFHIYNYQKTIRNYFYCIINTIKHLNQSKKEHNITIFISKLKIDSDHFQKNYKNLVQQAYSCKMMKEIREIILLLQENELCKIKQACINLKQGLFHQVLTQQVLIEILNYKYNNNLEVVNNVMNMCKHVFQKSLQQNIRKDSIFEYGDIKSDQNQQCRSRKSTLTISLSTQVIRKTLFQGFLESKIINTKIDYQQKYFRLYEDQLNRYKSYNLEQVQHTINLNEIKKVEINQKRNYKFSIQLINGTVYKFKTSSIFLCQQWVDQIQKNCLTYFNYITISKIDTTQQQLFTDYFSDKNLDKANIKYLIHNENYVKKQRKLLKHKTQKSIINSDKIFSKQKRDIKTVKEKKQSYSSNKWYQLGCIKLE